MASTPGQARTTLTGRPQSPLSEEDLAAAKDIAERSTASARVGTASGKLPSWRTPAYEALAHKLEAKPWNFHFFNLMRRIDASMPPEYPPLGKSRRPREEPMRLGQEPTLTFASSPISSFKRGTGGKRDQLLVNFFGLNHAQGPMHRVFVDYVRNRRRRSHDNTLFAFLNIFHHRLLTLFYRAWAVNSQAASHQRPDNDRFAAYVGSLIGIGMDSYLQRDKVQDRAKLHYAGRLTGTPRSPESIAAVLSDYFKVPVVVQEFVGQWIQLPPDSRCQLGRSADTGRMGLNLMVGSRFWDCQQKFRLRAGPLSLADYRRLLPDREGLARLRDWIRNMLGDQFCCDVQLVLKREEVPSAQLGAGSQLGWTTWSLTALPETDQDNLVLNIL